MMLDDGPSSSPSRTSPSFTSWRGGRSDHGSRVRTAAKREQHERDDEEGRPRARAGRDRGEPLHEEEDRGGARRGGCCAAA